MTVRHQSGNLLFQLKSRVVPSVLLPRRHLNIDHGLLLQTKVIKKSNS